MDTTYLVHRASFHSLTAVPIHYRFLPAMSEFNASWIEWTTNVVSTLPSYGCSKLEMSSAYGIERTRPSTLRDYILWRIEVWGKKHSASYVHVQQSSPRRLNTIDRVRGPVSVLEVPGSTLLLVVSQEGCRSSIYRMYLVVRPAPASRCLVERRRNDRRRRK